jgi:hypothetical protein
MRATFLIAGLVSVSISPRAMAKIEIAPMPREVGEVRPAAVSPAETVERIVKNATEAGNRLAKLDPGQDTRKTQKDVLNDIDALIQQQENPPPMPMSGSSDSKPMDRSQSPMSEGSQSKSKSKDGTGQSSSSRPSPGLPSENEGPPQPMGQRKRVHRNQPMPGGDSQPLLEKVAGSQPKGKKDDSSSKDAGTNTGKGVAGGASGKPDPKAGMPLEGDVAKDVWGHLPEQLRQQVSEYYRQQFMPQYAELLRQYYLSLAERDHKPGEPNR